MNHGWWYLARAAGLVAWGLSLASVLWGVALATRALGNRPKAPWLLSLHRHLGGLTVLFVGLHVSALVADSYVQFGVADVLVPGASAWRPLAITWGIISLYLLAAIEVSSLLMRQVPKRWWRRIHLTSYAVAVLSTIHLFTAGTDAANPILTWATVGVAGVTSFFLAYRGLGAPRSSRAQHRPAGDALGHQAQPVVLHPGGPGVHGE